MPPPSAQTIKETIRGCRFRHLQSFHLAAVADGFDALNDDALAITETRKHLDAIPKRLAGFNQPQARDAIRLNDVNADQLTVLDDSFLRHGDGLLLPHKESCFAVETGTQQPLMVGAPDVG